MSHTNRSELNKLFDHFCLLWAEGQHATVQIQSLGNGKARAKLEVELGKLGEIFPADPAGFQRGTPRGGARRQPRHHQQDFLPVPDHPGKTGNRRRHRGPAAIARSKERAAAYQASLAAAKSVAGPTPPIIGGQNCTTPLDWDSIGKKGRYFGINPKSIGINLVPSQSHAIPNPDQTPLRISLKYQQFCTKKKSLDF